VYEVHQKVNTMNLKEVLLVCTVKVLKMENNGGKDVQEEIKESKVSK
jgi:hypothetical protein